MGSRAEIWHTDPATLRDIVLERTAVEDRLAGCPPLERVWLLSLLGRDEEALTEGQTLLAGSQDRFKPLLVLAQVYQRQYRWHEAAQLHEEALRRSAGASSMKPDTGTLRQNSNGPATCTGPLDGTTWPRCPGRPCSVPAIFTIPAEPQRPYTCREQRDLRAGTKAGVGKIELILRKRWLRLNPCDGK
ncbi:hypothetical protein QF036_002066 [Arthrobacter globiformis]|nr:hypothetical protein [Arthrobacter globiformis]